MSEYKEGDRIRIKRGTCEDPVDQKYVGKCGTVLEPASFFTGMWRVEPDNDTPILLYPDEMEAVEA